MSFENFQIRPENLPSIDDLEFTSLESNYLTVQLIGSSIFSFFLLAGVSVFILLNEIGYAGYFNLLIIAFFLILVLLIFYTTYFGFKMKGYALREKDIAYKSGLWWKSQTSIPFNRVQHCEVKQGPIERYYKLSQLIVYTAGGSQSDLNVPGLSNDRAQALKRFILRQTVLDEEE